MKSPTIKTYQHEAYEIFPSKKDDTIDYLYFVTKSSTKAQRRKFGIGDVFINGAVCLSCKQFIRSHNLHDYRKCSCGKVIVDGGSWYCKRGGEGERIDVVENFYDWLSPEPDHESIVQPHN